MRLVSVGCPINEVESLRRDSVRGCLGCLDNRNEKFLTSMEVKSIHSRGRVTGARLGLKRRLGRGRHLAVGRAPISRGIDPDH
jgi:hypothetical protein